MVITTFLVLIPLSLIASSIYSYLIFSKHPLYNGIKNKIIKIFLKILTYVIIILFFTIVLSILSFALLVGLIGMPILIILNIVGIILLVKKIISSIKNKKT